ncbi:MAG: hypothetical protein ACTHU0_25050, partial [Kofleriaceae bacterium]
DHAVIELGDGGSYHAVYTNSADYGREAIFSGGKLYLRPRYQRWHARAPETTDEPAAVRDQYFGALAAAWDLLAPGVELTDRGQVQVGGRVGRKIEIKRAASPAKPPEEPLSQRSWREGRTIDQVSGEIVIDAEKAVPLSAKLDGTIGFTRDGRRFSMKLGVATQIAAIGAPVAVAVPAEGEVVATPERLREVDDRDFLLQGIAPPLRRNPDGTAATPQPASAAAAGSAAPATPAAPTDKTTDKTKRSEKSEKSEKSDKKSDAPEKKSDRSEKSEKSEAAP